MIAASGTDFSTTSSVTAMSRQARYTIAVWLLVLCAMIFLMVVLGGVTRLQHAGLSIVHWKPISGILPPLNAEQWQAEFEAYQKFPEYQKLNQGMDLAGFKSIFWLEFLHRLWGRLIGMVFLIPFVIFCVRGWVRGAWIPKLLFAFVLGGLQGVLGWVMVKSGLVDRPDVSAYRLTAHLGSALLIYGYLFWLALSLLRPEAETAASRGLRFGVIGVAVLVVATVLSGGFVAGTDAGFSYNTFPLMGGRLVPEGLGMLEPAWRNVFENTITVQFDHRVLAISTFFSVVAVWLAALRHSLSDFQRAALHMFLGAVLLQVFLGISTLLLVVPVPLAAAHQAGALVLFTASLWALFELTRGK
jgi:cytochrome c oxidase assembly protein subunit 15